MQKFRGKLVISGIPEEQWYSYGLADFLWVNFDEAVPVKEKGNFFGIQGVFYLTEEVSNVLSVINT